jgi:hypothetical protein
MIALQITDQKTGHDYVINVSMHDAQKLYKALREIVGDVQYQARPGDLITVPDMSIKL